MTVIVAVSITVMLEFHNSVATYSRASVRADRYAGCGGAGCIGSADGVGRGVDHRDGAARSGDVDAAAVGADRDVPRSKSTVANLIVSTTVLVLVSITDTVLAF